MKVIITGALGHIGSFLLRSLPLDNKDLEIHMIDDLSTQRYSSLFNLENNAMYVFYETDLLSTNLDEIIDGSIVIHLAAATDAASSFDNRTLVEKNLLLTETVAKTCAKHGSKLIFPSTTSVYGTQHQQVDEYCKPEELKPQSPYAETKLREEEILRDLGQSDGLNFVICRLGTIFGVSAGMRFHTAVNKFCWQAAMGQAITVWKTAYNQKRPYLDLLDASRTFQYIINNDIFDQQIYNIVSDNYTVKDLLNIVRSIVPEISVNFTESKIMNQLSYEVSCDKFKALNFHFLGNIERSICDTITLLNSAIKNKVERKQKNKK